MSDYLLLGPVLMEGFELPQGIAWGGRQRVAVHRLPGGRRVLDSMGRDDAEISWSGMFTGDNAGYRARLVDLLRADGSVWPLTWDSFFYSVVISNFQADYQRPRWIPFRITCTVLRDEAEGLVEDALSLLASAADDLAAAGDLAPGLDRLVLPVAVAAAGASLASRDTTSAAGLRGARDDSGLLAQQSLAQGYANRARPLPTPIGAEPCAASPSSPAISSPSPRANSATPRNGSASPGSTACPTRCCAAS